MNPEKMNSYPYPLRVKARVVNFEGQKWVDLFYERRELEQSTSRVYENPAAE